MLNSLRARITVILILLMILSGAVGNYLIYEYSMKSQMEQLRDKLKIIAQAIAITIDAGEILNIPLTKDGRGSAAYRSVEEKLFKIRDLAPSIVYIYILAKTEEKKIFKFIIDVHSGATPIENKPASPGESYDISGCAEIPKAFSGPASDQCLIGDRWGVFLSGYAPIRDAKGNAVAILGVDVSAKDVYKLQKEVKKRAVLVLLFGAILSLIIGILISRKVTDPVKKLVDGTRNIAAGNLDYRVDVKSPDELRELAESFNQMAFKLDSARREVAGYFYRVAQTLVRVLEAIDPYTKGHSDRVAEYSERIAREMGLPAERIKVLKEAALLHDIGKMGIRDIIFGKKAELTPADMTTVHKHTLIGEDILKPISYDKELLAAVRGHHERYDGTGYPDRLKGDNIDMLASIVSVADAYDAMTTQRSYNVVLSKEKAIAELRKKSGTQFNPAVVEALIKILG